MILKLDCIVVDFLMYAITESVPITTKLFHSCHGEVYLIVDTTLYDKVFSKPDSNSLIFS